FVCWGLEMNGTWFPWSGYFYRDKNARNEDEGWTAGVEKYKKAYRYVVDHVRARGARNILWVYHANNYSYPTDDWNAIEKYYPGDGYVDWIGMSAYGQQFPADAWVYFHDTVDYPYQLLAALHPTKPIMMAEWGVGEFPPSKRKAEWIREALKSFVRNYPRLKIAIFWNERWANEDGSYSNLHADSSLESLKAFRDGMADPLWIDRPAPHLKAK
ncbi:MAG: glycosyl hydrolase, partial [Methylacidiphilales bacterium]|nr:glycosyl hydrolase [Candidatus Methylacidiphilales bacterium]